VNPLHVRVTRVTTLTPVVKEYLLCSDCGNLPAFSAGSHVRVTIPDGNATITNAYSLSAATDPTTGAPAYRIAVRLQPDSRGGSRALHQQVRAGDVLRISPPANLFPLHSQARHHLLVAGGIGITPFLAYADALEATGASFTLHYAGRPGQTDAYAGALRERLGERFHGYSGAPGDRLDVPTLLAGQRAGTHVYTCGPASLIDGVAAAARALGWPASSVHAEAFAAAKPGAPFRVELRRSGTAIDVPSSRSLLEALEQAGIAVPNLCRGGVCGQCALPYAGGDVEHRDHFLAPGDRLQFLMPCVSRGCGTPIFLDL